MDTRSLFAKKTLFFILWCCVMWGGDASYAAIIEGSFVNPHASQNAGSTETLPKVGDLEKDLSELKEPIEETDVIKTLAGQDTGKEAHPAVPSNDLPTLSLHPEVQPPALIRPLREDL